MYAGIRSLAKYMKLNSGTRDLGASRIAYGHLSDHNGNPRPQTDRQEAMVANSGKL